MVKNRFLMTLLLGSGGDKIGIVGINGTGKTTLLRMVIGEETPDTGQIVRQNGKSLLICLRIRRTTRRRRWKSTLWEGIRMRTGKYRAF